MRYYDSCRYVYETPIERYTTNALAKAAERAVERAGRYHEASEHGWAFRVTDCTYASSDPWGDGDGWSFSTQLEIIAFPIIAMTPTGFRIRRGGTDAQPETRFVSRDWRKKWASETPEGALNDYIARRKRQAAIYEAKASKARKLIGYAMLVLGKGEPCPAI